jgi:hypothetical protein
MDGLLIARSIGAVSLSQDASLQPAQRSPLSPFFQQCHTLLESSYRIVSSSLVGRVSYGLWSNLAYLLVDVISSDLRPSLEEKERQDQKAMSTLKVDQRNAIKSLKINSEKIQYLESSIKFTESELEKCLLEVCSDTKKSSR